MRERERGSYSILELSGILSPIRKEGKKKKKIQDSESDLSSVDFSSSLK